jgi:hypothetical protein
MEGTSARKRPALLATTVAVGLILLLAVAATAHQILTGPSIEGSPQQGQTLTAKATWKGQEPMTVEWKWQRCLAVDTKNCVIIAGAKEQTYVLTAADVGFVIRVRLKITDDEHSIGKRSKPTSVILPATDPTPPPEDTGEPEPEPEPEDPGGDPPAPDEPFNPPANPNTSPPPAGTEHLKVMKPFPVVRISGRLTTTGARITRLTVRAKKGASIDLRCRGRSCPSRKFARAASLRRFKEFERHLRAGTRLTIIVSKPGRIGKWTRITIRRGAVPKRLDQCSYPGRERPAACPAP